ncbi:MAG TPA: CBS domain-containing protein [bacterium]|nr:CBS domain-containing protein [bacterium]
MRSPLAIPKTSPLKAVFSLMRKENKGYAVVLEDEASRKVAGIFTERDVMTRVAEQKIAASTPVEKVMTPQPTTLKLTDSVADAIRLMSQGRYRHLPLVDEAGGLVGVLSVRDLITYLAEHYPHQVFNLPPDPHQVIRAPEGA